MRALLITFVAAITTAAVQAAQPVAWRIVSVHDCDTVTAVDPAQDIAATYPYYAAKSFKALGP
jgi:hypothetical protein